MRMRTDFSTLKKFDFISLDSKTWGSLDCIITSNKDDRLIFLATGPYENSDNRDFSYLSFMDDYNNLNGFYYKSIEDIFMLIGMNDKRIIEMICRIG